MRNKMLLLLTVSLCLVLSSCNGTQVPPNEISSNYRTGEILFLKGQFREAAENFEEFIAENARSKFCSDAHYWAGLCALNLESTERARKHLYTAYSRPRTSLMEGLSLAALADCDYMEKKFSQAATRYRQAMGMPGVQKARTLYRLGMCYSRTGNPQQARLCFQEVTQSFRGTKYADLAKDRLSFSEDGFCVQVGALSTRNKADILREKLVNQNFPAYVRLVSRGGKSLFCVRVGHFDTWEKANDLAKKIKRARFDAIVIP